MSARDNSVRRAKALTKQIVREVESTGALITEACERSIDALLRDELFAAMNQGRAQAVSRMSHEFDGWVAR